MPEPETPDTTTTTTTTTTIEGQSFTCTSSQVESPSSLDVNPCTLGGGERVREVGATAPKQPAVYLVAEELVVTIFVNLRLSFVSN